MISNQSRTSRRRFLEFASLSAAAAIFAPRNLSFLVSLDAEDVARVPGLVQQMRKSGATATITVQPLRRKINAVIGSGGNIAVLPGPDGKLLIDAGFATSRPKIADALAKISSDPIKQLINTHWHFDHTDGNEWLHSGGAAILAHENTRKHLSTSTRVEGWDFTFPPLPSGGIPTTVFTDEKTVRMNGTNVVLKHYRPAHTDSDISVHFVEADVIHVGDTWWNGIYPFIDYSTGGSIDGTIRATQSNLAKVTDKMIIIPGHGPVGDKSQLTAYRDMLVDVRNKVANLKKQGRALKDIVAAKPTATYDAKWGGGLMSPAVFTGLVFQGI